jgi:hypothetical protein
VWFRYTYFFQSIYPHISLTDSKRVLIWGQIKDKAQIGSVVFAICDVYSTRYIPDIEGENAMCGMDVNSMHFGLGRWYVGIVRVNDPKETSNVLTFACVGLSYQQERVMVSHIWSGYTLL